MTGKGVKLLTLGCGNVTAGLLLVAFARSENVSPPILYVVLLVLAGGFIGLSSAKDMWVRRLEPLVLLLAAFWMLMVPTPPYAVAAVGSIALGCGLVQLLGSILKPLDGG